MKKHPPAISVLRARSMRNSPTEAEKAMWSLLRRNFPDARFRRQVPIRHFIVDFASHRLRTAIEIDGGQHSAKSDAARTWVIEAAGYTMIRFWNNEVLENPAGCMVQLGQLLS